MTPLIYQVEMSGSLWSVRPDSKSPLRVGFCLMNGSENFF